MAAGDPAPNPLSPADRLDLLPRVAVALAYGAKHLKSGPIVRVAFEDAGYEMHPDDFEIARRASERIRYFLKGGSRPAILDAHDNARKCIAEELFRPGAIRIIYYPSVIKATAFYRCVLPVLELGQRGNVVAHLRRGSAREALDYDVTVIQLDHSKSSLQFARSLQSMGKKVVFELDDALESIETWHDRRIDPGEVETWRSMIANADAVMVTTEDLRARYEKISKRVEVFPNCMKLSQWPKTKPHDKEEFRILWAGSPTHAGDLEVVSRAVERICKEVPHARMVFFGMAPERLRVKSTQIEAIPFCDFEEYPVRLADVRADVAIAPLAPCSFNESKSPIKILEYWATGYPVVASDFGPYKIVKGGVDGILCQTENDWVAAIARLLARSDLRENLVKSGTDSVSHYDIGLHAGKLESFFQSLRGA